MLPGPDLAWHLGQARQRGLGVLSDDELIGVLGTARRLGSWQAELELAAVAELDARRADPDGREGEHVAEEVAAALTLTGRSADTLLELSRRLERSARPLARCWRPGSSTVPGPGSSPISSPCWTTTRPRRWRPGRAARGRR